MKLLHSNIVMVEDGDTRDSIVAWMHTNTDIGRINPDFNGEDWLHSLKDGDIILMNPVDRNTGMFMTNVNMFTKTDLDHARSLYYAHYEASEKETTDGTTNTP